MLIDMFNKIEIMNEDQYREYIKKLLVQRVGNGIGTPLPPKPDTEKALEDFIRAFIE